MTTRKIMLINLLRTNNLIKNVRKTGILKVDNSSVIPNIAANNYVPVSVAETIKFGILIATHS